MIGWICAEGDAEEGWGSGEIEMSIRRVTSLLSFALMAFGPPPAGAQKPACSTGTIQTSSGPVCGMTSSVTLTGRGTVTAAAYLGIPYAVPPIGSLRWQYSTPFQGPGSLPATAFGSECPRAQAPPRSAASSSRCTDGKALGLGESEDCLSLN